MSVINYLYPHCIDQFTFATTTTGSQIDMEVFIKSFDWIEWLLLVFFLFFLFDRLTNLVEHRKFHDSFVWISVFIIFRQPYRLINRSNSSRKLCAIIWLFSALVLFNVYCCRLYSILTIRTNHVVDTVDKLAKGAVQNSIIPVVMDSSVYQMLNNSGITSYDLISDKSIQVAHLNDGINLIIQTSKQLKKSFSEKHKAYAFIATRFSLEFAQLNYGDKLMYIPPPTIQAEFFPLFISILFGETFDHRDEFNYMYDQTWNDRIFKLFKLLHYHYRISHLHSAGIFDYWKFQELSTTKYKVSNHISIDDAQLYDEKNMKIDMQQLSVEHYHSLFILFAIMTIVSTAVFCFEFFFQIITNKNNWCSWEWYLRILRMTIRVWVNIVFSQVWYAV